MPANPQAQAEELQRLKEATKAGIPFKRKHGRPPGKKVKLTPDEYNTKRRRQRKRQGRRFDHDSKFAQTMRDRWKDPSYRQVMEEKVFGPRRRGEMPPARHRVPDGHTKETAEVMFAEAAKKAEVVLAKLKEKGVVDFSNLPTSDADRAEMALKECLTIGMSESATQYRIAALSQVLKYCRPVERKSRITVESAEAWLAEAIADNEEDSDDEQAEASD